MVKKTIAAIFSVLVLSSVLTACNTTRGVGEDISDGGNATRFLAQQLKLRTNESDGTAANFTVPSIFHFL